MKKITVNELGKIITGHTPPTTKREFYGDAYPFLKPTDMVVGSKFTYEVEEGYSELAAQKYSSSLIPKNSTCVVCIGTLGEKMCMAHCDLFTNQSVNSIIPSEEYDPGYVYYLLKYNLHRVKALNKGTASGREFVSKSTFLDLELDVYEDISMQKKVSDILSLFDDLIENNQKQIKLLEEIASRLYIEWFVKFHFPDYENCTFENGIPVGWSTCQLCEVVSINDENISKKYAYDYVDYIDLGSVNNGLTEMITRYSLKEAPGRAKRVAKDGDMAWGMVRPNLKSYAYVFNPTETTIYSTGFAVLHPVKIPFTYLYCYASTDEFVGYLINCTNGAAYPAVKTEHFESAKIVVPSKDILEQFQIVLEPVYRKIELLVY